MKCPKCGYVSFDHHQACPKCKKDISEERNKLNLPDFEPSVPFLLGALTGEADEGHMDINLAGPEAPVMRAPEEAAVFEEQEGEASLEEELDISLDEEWSPAMEEETVVAEDLPGVEPEEEAIELEESDDELSLDLEDMEGPAAEELDLSMEEDAVSLDLDELGLDEEEITEDVTEEASPTEEEQEPEFELDSIALDAEDAAPVQEPEQEEMVLNLDDLKINETGELEIGTPQMEPAEPLGEETIDLEGIAFEEPEERKEAPGAEATTSDSLEDFTMDLDDLSLEEPAPQQAQGQAQEEEEDLGLDLDDLELELDLEEEPNKSS